MSRDATTRRQPVEKDCEEVRAALGAYALGVLEPEESTPLEAHLATCPRCDADLARYERALATLGAAVAPVVPPATLRDRLLTAAGKGELEEPIDVAGEHLGRLPAHSDRPVAIRRWWETPVMLPRMAAIGMALVASLLLVGLIVGAALFQRVQDERDAAQTNQREIAEYLRNGGVVTPLVTMQSGGDGTVAGSGSLVIAPDQSSALLVVDRLPPSNPQRSYRVWVARAGERTRVDELRVGSDGTGWLTLATAEPLVSYDAVGITVVNPDTSQRQDLLTAPISDSAVQ